MWHPVPYEYLHLLQSGHHFYTIANQQVANAIIVNFRRQFFSFQVLKWLRAVKWVKSAGPASAT